MAPQVTPKTAKVHLAGWNGEEDPLRVYFDGRFDDWQAWQAKRNFERAFVVSLIQLSERNKWLFVGLYASHGCVPNPKGEGYRYKLERMAAGEQLAGRLVVDYARSGRAAYLLADGAADRMAIHAIRPEPMHLEEFPGFKHVDLGISDLRIVVRQNTTSWRTALANVAGVYLISDPDDGKLYVGSATGEGGLWARWCQYVDGHAGNVELFKLFKEMGIERSRSFRFSILEIADVHSSLEEILKRESHWKKVLLSRSHGYNAN